MRLKDGEGEKLAEGGEADFESVRSADRVPLFVNECEIVGEDDFDAVGVFVATKVQLYEEECVAVAEGLSDGVKDGL